MWNYIYRHLPLWKAGEVDIINGEDQYVYIINNLDTKERFVKVNKKDNDPGDTVYFCYKINGIVHCNYSKIIKILGRKIEIQLGAGGNEWRLWFKA